MHCQPLLVYVSFCSSRVVSVCLLPLPLPLHLPLPLSLPLPLPLPLPLSLCLCLWLCLCLCLGLYLCLYQSLCGCQRLVNHGGRGAPAVNGSAGRCCRWCGPHQYMLQLCQLLDAVKRSFMSACGGVTGRWVAGRVAPRGMQALML